MLKPHYIILLASLLVDGGTAAPQPSSEPVDGGTVTPLPIPTPADAGTAAPQPNTADSIHWPENLQPLATLDGPAVIAAHAALQHLLARFPKEDAGRCGYSPKGLEVIVGQEGDLYFVRIEQRMDKCGWAVPPGFSTETDWFELYAVSADGRVLARAPYAP